jgi:3-phosphoshikimate 1-carboxyvinyltransferase
MRVRVTPGSTLEGEVVVAGDKSIAHRWLILAATAKGTSRLVGLPPSLDVRSTAACLSAVSGTARPALEAWSRNAPYLAEGHGSTWNAGSAHRVETLLEVESDGRSGLVAPSGNLDCGNSGTAMRLLAGTLAASPFRSVLVGDESLSGRPMERVAEPLREMGATVRTTQGHAPIEIEGGSLRGVHHRLPVPTAQVKGAILLAGVAAEGETTVDEPAATRDHTERALAALGAGVRTEGTTISIDGGFQHEGFAGSVPGDVSSAAFLLAAAALTGSELTVRGVGLNSSRLGFLNVLARMGVRTETHVDREELGEPVGELRVAATAGLTGTEVATAELPLVIDEVPVLALVAAHARGETWFGDAAELRVKESDRLSGIVEGVRALGGRAGAEGNDLVVAGTGLGGGRADALGDHRLAMAFAVAALAADGPCEIDGMEAADVSFPGFVHVLTSLGANVEVIG